MAGVSRFIGSSYKELFFELGLNMETIDHTCLTDPYIDCQGTVVVLLKAWTNKFGKKATIEQLLLIMKSQDLPYEDVISCFFRKSTPFSPGKQRPANVVSLIIVSQL